MITSEAAKLLNVSKSTIARWILSGKIKQIEKQKH
jgi:excisionase family DNA binding protein